MRLRFVFTMLLIASVLSVSARSSLASVPSAMNSTIPPCMAVCPQGDLVYSVVIRDIANLPMSGAVVSFDFSGCPNVHLCPPGPPPGYTISPLGIVYVVTDPLGRAALNLQAVGTQAACVKIYADGVLMTDGLSHPLVSLANADQSGDGFVGSDDAAILAAKIASDPTADLDCNGVHDAADDALLAAHIGHFCPGLVDPVRSSTWGQLKILYR